MSLDLEDRLEHGLGELARRAPVPDEWPELGTRIIPIDPRPPRRPRLITGLVAAAAAIVVIAAAAFVVNRDDGTGPTNVAAAPSSTDDAAGSAALGGHWSGTGPRLTDEQLSSIIATVELPDGTSTVVPRSGYGADEQGAPPDHSEKVVDVSVARTNGPDFSVACRPDMDAYPSGDGCLTADQRMAIVQYLASLPPPQDQQSDTGLVGTGPEVLMAVVRSVPLGTAPGSVCRSSSAADAGDCDRHAVDRVWVFAPTGPAAGDFVMMARIPHVDVLAGLEPIGRWTPDGVSPATSRPAASTSVDPVPSSTTGATEAAPSTSATPPTSVGSDSPPSTVAPSSTFSSPTTTAARGSGTSLEPPTSPATTPDRTSKGP